MLCRDDVEPFGFLLADHMHAAAAAGARCRLRFDHHLDPRQMRGQRFALAGLAPRARRRRPLFRRRLLARRRDLALFKSKGQLVGVEPLRASAILRPLELADDVVHRLDPAGQLVALGQQPQRHCP